MRVLILSHRDVLEALQPGPCAEAMAAVLAGHARGETFMPLRSVVVPPDAAGFMGLMPGWRGPHGDGAAAFALKAVCIMPGNPARGLDAHQGLVTLFDGQTGMPSAILDDEIEMQAVRRPLVMAGRAIELRGETARCIAPAIEKRQPSLIVECALDVVGVPDDMPAIGRIARVRVAEAALRGKRPMPPRRRCDDDDIGLVHHLRLGREVDGHRELATVRRNVVEGCGRFPRRQRESGAGEQIA